MIVACLTAVIAVLERQYKRYFGINLTAELKKETESACSHNIDAEEVMGMFSAAKHRVPNATRNPVLPFFQNESKKKSNS